MHKEIIARKRYDGKQQSLHAHSKNVADISSSNSHYYNTSILIAYLHDLGKISADFQKYIRIGGERGSIIHAWQGAFYVNELSSDNSMPALLLKEIIGFCITSHHSHLHDGVSPDGGTVDRNINLEEFNYSANNN